MHKASRLRCAILLARLLRRGSCDWVSVSLLSLTLISFCGSTPSGNESMRLAEMVQLR
jgi:hypothetical protein